LTMSYRPVASWVCRWRARAVNGVQCVPLCSTCVAVRVFMQGPAPVPQCICWQPAQHSTQRSASAEVWKPRHLLHLRWPIMARGAVACRVTSAPTPTPFPRAECLICRTTPCRARCRQSLPTASPPCRSSAWPTTACLPCRTLEPERGSSAFGALEHSGCSVHCRIFGRALGRLGQFAARLSTPPPPMYRSTGRRRALRAHACTV
jgi:hypothetical protein